MEVSHIVAQVSLVDTDVVHVVEVVSDVEVLVSQVVIHSVI